MLNGAAKSSVISDRELEDEKTYDPSGPRIRCPQCGWSPRKEDKWFCTCGNEWNTFDTGGLCPACLHQWADTPIDSVCDFTRRKLPEFFRELPSTLLTVTTHIQSRVSTS